MDPRQVLPVNIQEVLGVMANILTRSPELALPHHMQFSVISRYPFWETFLALCRGYRQHILASSTG